MTGKKLYDLLNSKMKHPEVMVDYKELPYSSREPYILTAKELTITAEQLINEHWPTAEQLYDVWRRKMYGVGNRDIKWADVAKVKKAYFKAMAKELGGK